MEENLFREFPEVSAEQWKQQIQRDLKGADYNEKLIYYSPDGIKVQPFYHSEESKRKCPSTTTRKMVYLRKNPGSHCQRRERQSKICS